ncbi:enoyl-CoA hydratase/isomerase family protein [Subtercola sp. RTI3]|uniref:enoyl-CoA hydratase/isomerase family protein n=1 Tax=Subtercola sp. RTI3 TaxID=3048639 RepID=UPI002B2286F0|nr:enoyl-CoA hydratase/isomerase family protein [Subtercola sp. RTI3]MEA9985765.1 enoyl-CoA hydratase/isomerase family protein [Subtercola sp. RTI3]
MNYIDLSGLRVRIDQGVAYVTIDNPPLNLLDGILLPSLRRFVWAVREDIDVRVIVFESADPEFFIAHGDMRFITEPASVMAATDAVLAAAPDVPVPATLNMMAAVHEEIRALPQLTIGKIAGFARGGGNELLMALDMRFAAIGKSGQAQPEALMGIIPGGGGTQYMTALIGRARALELILGAELVDAELAEKYGLVNRALPASDLDSFVGELALRIASLRPGIIAAAKTAVGASRTPISVEGLSIENKASMSLFTSDSANLAQQQLRAGVQTREGERDLEGLLLGMKRS